jgi:ATP-dependent Clp protease protease subunit
MTHSWSPGTATDTATDTWPWPPEVPRRPHQPPYPPYHPPETPTEPSPPSPPSPAPILPTWEEPDPDWAERHILDRLLDQRVILVTGHLDTKMAERASAQLLLLDRTDHTRPIELHLSCRGSDLEASVALAAALDLTRAQVHAVVTGTLSGPAIAALCAASERAAHRHATFVLDLPHPSAQGSATTVATQAEEHQRAVAQLVERIATVSGRAEELVDEDLRSGRVLSAEEARSYGLVSRLV